MAARRSSARTGLYHQAVSLGQTSEIQTNPTATLDFHMAFSITSLLLFAIFLGIFLLITVPLTGALVRLRANYNPKGLQLDPENGVQPHTGPVITSFFLMLSRVRRLEVRSATFHNSLGSLSGCIGPGLGWPYERHEYAEFPCYLSNWLLLFFLTSADIVIQCCAFTFFRHFS